MAHGRALLFAKQKTGENDTVAMKMASQKSYEKANMGRLSAAFRFVS